MRPGRTSGRTDIADNLPLLDSDARTDAFGKTVHMRVSGRKLRIMADNHIASITAGPLRAFDHAVRARVNPRAFRRRVVHAAVQDAPLQNRVPPPAETRRNPRRPEFHRFAVKSPFQHNPLGIVVVHAAIQIFVAVQRNLVPPQIQLRIQNVAVFDDLAVRRHLAVKQNLERIAALDVRTEIDRIGENIDKVADNAGRHTRILHRRRQRRGNAALRRLVLGL